jgi:hypothetical protein
LPTRQIDWSQAWRIIASRYPPIDLFERLTPDPAVWEALMALEQLTNGRREGASFGRRRSTALSASSRAARVACSISSGIATRRRSDGRASLSAGSVTRVSANSHHRVDAGRMSWLRKVQHSPLSRRQMHILHHEYRCGASWRGEVRGFDKNTPRGAPLQSSVVRAQLGVGCVTRKYAIRNRSMMQ